MTRQIFTVDPNEIKFPIDPKKQVSSSLQLGNMTDSYVAFKVKTTSPKKYSVKPNTGLIVPQGSAVIVVTMQPQRETPSDLQSKDKFLIQGVLVPDETTSKDISQDWFNRNSGKELQEVKLKVVYLPPPQPPSPVPESAEEGLSPKSSILTENGDQSVFARELVSKEVMGLKAKLNEARANFKSIQEEYALVMLQSRQLEEQLSKMKGGGKASNNVDVVSKSQPGFSFLFVLLFGLLGILVGYLFTS